MFTHMLCFLQNRVTEDIPKPDAPLTADEQAIVARLTEAEINDIDETIVSSVSVRWKKVAMVVGVAMEQFLERYTDIPGVFYADRVRKLVGEGRLESQGDLAYMRFSEVRKLSESDET